MENVDMMTREGKILKVFWKIFNQAESQNIGYEEDNFKGKKTIYVYNSFGKIGYIKLVYDVEYYFFGLFKETTFEIRVSVKDEKNGIWHDALFEDDECEAERVEELFKAHKEKLKQEKKEREEEREEESLNSLL